VTWVVVGASAGLGRALSEALARRGGGLLLVASDERDLAPLASDLRLAAGSEARTLAHDAADHAGLARRVAEALSADARVDGLLFPLGWTRADDDGTLAPAEAERLLQVNFLSVASVVGRLLPRLLAQGSGSVVGFGSVAATRGRGRNVVYSASKRALESYFESLRHLAQPQGLTVSFYTLGYLDTSLAFGQRLALPKADPRRLAARVCGELGRRAGSRYAPRWWWPLTRVVRWLPWPLFQRMRF
jgi:short-subunit dehydrogenase